MIPGYCTLCRETVANRINDISSSGGRKASPVTHSLFTIRSDGLFDVTVTLPEPWVIPNIDRRQRDAATGM